MSEFHVDPSKGVAGRLTVPGDKSISHRALMLGAIAEGTTHIEGFLESEDCLATLAALEHLGVTVHRPGPGRVEVVGVGLRGLCAPAAPLDMRNAGTAMRLFMGLLAPQAFESVLVGDESLMRRPMERAAQPLRAMGARIDTDGGRPPVRIRRRRASAGTAAARCRSGKCAGEIRAAACGSLRRGSDDGDRAGAHARSHRADAAGVWLRAREPRRPNDAAAAAATAGHADRRAWGLLIGRILHRRRLHRRCRAAPSSRGSVSIRRAQGCSRCWR